MGHTDLRASESLLTTGLFFAHFLGDPPIDLVAESGTAARWWHGGEPSATGDVGSPNLGQVSSIRARTCPNKFFMERH